MPCPGATGIPSYGAGGAAAALSGVAGPFSDAPKFGQSGPASTYYSITGIPAGAGASPSSMMNVGLHRPPVWLTVLAIVAAVAVAVAIVRK